MAEKKSYNQKLVNIGEYLTQKRKALGKGLEQLFNSEVLDFDSFESNILESTSVIVSFPKNSFAFSDPI